MQSRRPDFKECRRAARPVMSSQWASPATTRYLQEGHRSRQAAVGIVFASSRSTLYRQGGLHRFFTGRVQNLDQLLPWNWKTTPANSRHERAAVLLPAAFTVRLRPRGIGFDCCGSGEEAARSHYLSDDGSRHHANTGRDCIDKKIAQPRVAPRNSKIERFPSPLRNR